MSESKGRFPLSTPLHNTNPPLRLLAAFQSNFSTATPQHILQSPGREMWIAASICDGETYTIVTPDLDGRVVFNWRTAKMKRTVTNRPLPSWARYPAGAIVILGAEGFEIPGLNAVIVGEEPLGPRYDYALGMAIATFWHAFHNHPYTTDSLVEIVDRVRRDYLET
jgi:galactokinase